MPNVRGHVDSYIPGDWNAVCYVCGRKYKASEMVRYWKGYWVCRKDFEARQPQDFVKGVPDIQIPPWTQPLPAPIFVHICDPNAMSAVVDFAVVDCAIVDFLSPSFDPSITPGE